MKLFCKLLFAGSLLFSGLSYGQDYIFFLHQRFLEGRDINAVHPDYGRVEYKEIINTFTKKGFIVVNEKREANTDAPNYARKICCQVDSLIAKGVKPDHITVVGLSKGGYIAQYVSTFLNNPDVNYVFIGSYRDSDIADFPTIDWSGNILNIYDVSDAFGVSAVNKMKLSKNKIPHFKDVRLNTGLNHGFLFKALNDWLQPVMKWARRDYN